MLVRTDAVVRKAGDCADESGPPAERQGLSDEERAYRSLMRKWWFGAAVGIFTMIFSYPWLFPALRDWLPRGWPG